MSTKINLNYDQIVEDAIHNKEEADVYELARERAKSRAAQIVKDIMHRRENLRPGELNYFGNILWSRLDTLTLACEKSKEVLAKVFDNAAPALEKADQSGAAREFMEELTEKAVQRGAYERAFSGETISKALSNSWARLGAQAHEDEVLNPRPLHVEGARFRTSYNSYVFWDRPQGFGIDSLASALRLEHDERLESLLASFEQGNINASEFLQEVKKVFVENIDTSLHSVSEEISKSASVIANYHDQWLSQDPDKDFKAYFTGRAAHEIARVDMSEDSIRLNNLFIRVRDMPIHSPGVSLKGSEQLAQEIEDQLLPEEVDNVWVEKKKAATAAVEPTDSSVLQVDNFTMPPNTTDPSPEKSRPWYKRLLS